MSHHAVAATGSSIESSKPSFYTSIAIGLGVAGCIVFLVCAIFYYVVLGTNEFGDTKEWGSLGDYIGGIAGTAISLITLIALVITLRLQAVELDATRDLLRQQTATLHRQTIEATFFRMLELFDKTPGKRNILDLEQRFGAHFRTVLDRIGYPGNKDAGAKHLQLFRDAYHEAYVSKQAELAPYFLAFYHVINFVDQAALPDEDKARYTSIARARLGPQDLVLQFQNAAFGEEGKTGLRPLIERYGLLKHSKLVRFPNELLTFQHTVLDPMAYLSRAERIAEHERRQASPGII